ncbi:MAG: DUF6268 family outer membrane beta-barrel protein [Saprospiraceae bacterium]
MAKSTWLLVLTCFLLPLSAFAQDDPPMEEEGEEEFVDYSSFEQTAENKAYCSSRIIGQAPIKLFSLGYDVQGAHSLDVPYPNNPDEGSTYDINSAHGERFALNYPVFSKNNLLVNLGLNYAATRYTFDEPATSTTNPLVQSLDNNGLRTMGFTATVFKPLNSKFFILGQLGANLNGDYNISSVQSLEYTRYTGAAIFGIKKNERKMWGFGLSRTYLGGALNYVPVYYMLYTAENKKWGVEMLLPARFDYRRNINAKNILKLGWEIEGNTYRISNDEDIYRLPHNDIELRRSELRFRASWDYAITPQIALSAQVGYRYNYSFDVDRGDFVRLFGDDTPYLIETTLSNPPYVGISLNWVSP